MNAVLRYLEEEPEDEKNLELNIITHSSGNFAQAVCSMPRLRILPVVHGYDALAC